MTSVCLKAEIPEKFMEWRNFLPPFMLDPEILNDWAGS